MKSSPRECQLTTPPSQSAARVPALPARQPQRAVHTESHSSRAFTAAAWHLCMRRKSAYAAPSRCSRRRQPAADRQQRVPAAVPRRSFTDPHGCRHEVLSPTPLRESMAEIGHGLYHGTGGRGAVGRFNRGVRACLQETIQQRDWRVVGVV